VYKEDVVGLKTHPFYKWVREKLGLLSTPKWNFHKYLINRDGELVDYFNSNTAADSDKLIKAVEKLLNESARK
jgi:glutathione peroxidase